MSGLASPGGSEDVNDFLQRIKELGDRRDQEDEERNRKLEEEILQGRKERQARRAERARSISPTKSSPASTPTASRSSVAQSSAPTQSFSPTIIPSTRTGSERDITINDDAMDRLTGTSSSPTKENSSPFDLGRVAAESDLKRNISTKGSPSNAMPSRNSPLSWQRRPNSQSSDRPRSRPLSMVATENAARSPRATATPEPSSTEPTLSREQIAQSLASKDPAWFRQTADRGLSSPAYRRSQVEDEDRLDHSTNSSRVQMPGMSREPSELEKTMDGTARSPSSPSRSSPAYGSASNTSYHASPKLSGSIGSPIPLTPAQRLDPPSDPQTESRGLAMSPAQGRISPERFDRPVSPTKGMGGFVQSAMMKRSDSVNKRWSVQSPAGLSRVNSVASNRESGSGNVAAVRESKPSTLSRENSPHPSSRPTSSQSNTTYTQERPGTASSMRSSITISTNNEGYVKASLPMSRSQTPVGARGTQEEISVEIPTGISTPPSRSPSRAIDPSPSRRWSPTKSSWLETALNKPESPKPKAAPPPQQPAWMSEINKAKQKASIDLGRSPTVAPKHEVNIGGLMRSPPPGGLAKPLSIGGLPTGFSSGTVTRSRPESNASQESKDSTKPAGIVDSIIPTGVDNPKPSTPAASRTKPETPPKKDFRANLKSRQPPLNSSGSNEPEFKNVFGQLRRTKTQNYVAPDELKDNITRGKAALNLTGGPKKTERKDEFKEAILKKKDDFKKAQMEGKGVTRSASGGSQDTPLPEALAKRKALGRSDSIVAESEVASPEAPGRRTIRESPKPSLPTKETSAPGRLQGKDSVGGKLAGRLNPGLAGLLARGPPSMASDPSRSSALSPSQSSSSTSIATTEFSTTGPQLSHMTKGRARGPRRKAPTSTSTPAISSVMTSEIVTKTKLADAVEIKPSGQSQSITIHTSLNPQEPGELSPSKVDIENISQPSSPRKLDIKRRSQFLQEVANKNNKTEPQLDSPKSMSPTKKANFPEIPVKPQESKSEVTAQTTPKLKPSAPIKSPSLKSKSSMKSPTISRVDSQEAAVQPPPLSPAKPAERSTKLTAPNLLNDLVSEGRLIQSNASVSPDPPVSVKGAAALWDRPSGMESTRSPVQARSPIKLPTHDDEKAAMIGSGLRSASPVKKSPAGLGIHTARDFGTSRATPALPVKGPLSPPSSAGLLSPNRTTKALDSPTSQASDASKILDSFFGKERAAVPFKADTAAILSARPGQGLDIKTVRSTTYQLSKDGKKQLVPTHQERVLFEGNLYLCIHTFSTAAGKKLIEVYFWLGDDVSTHDIDEAKIFAQREAKSAGGNLITVHQGKETPEFFQALGGIIITRRGSSSKYDSLAPHILCGRKHFGQIAFDEVDFSPASLCSGFPYLISTQSGKSYLWKGRGSGIDELSCARLIGMDFGLTGEVEEVEDGYEPESFQKIFGQVVPIPKSADHWRMKPNYNKYSVRLFIADSAAKEQIKEISPFSQRDLSDDRIYVLDAFFEIYIIVGSNAQSQYRGFHNALIFGQEYGILAAGMEDRPFVPVTTVVLEGIPKDMKSVFRKWVEGLAPTLHKMPSSGSLQRGRSLRVVPLTAALEAIRS